MYKIKQIPEDFVVKEIITPKVTRTDGYVLCFMRKRDYTTHWACQEIAKALKVPLKFIGYAGNKDKNAVTEQLISIKALGKEQIEKLSLKGIQLEYVGISDEPVPLGSNEGNSFEITVRNITQKEHDKLIHYKRNIPNIFGEQRFSKNNAEIGKLIVKRNFAKAAALAAKGKGQEEARIREFLKKNKNNHIGALRQIPKKILLLHVHSYQSLLWNETVKQLLKKSRHHEDCDIPMIGFGMEIKDKTVKDIIDKIMKREGIKERDFVIREIPELSAEGVNRRLFVEPMNLDISRVMDDDLNKGKKKVLLKFALPKGSYATVAVEHLFGSQKA